MLWTAKDQREPYHWVRSDPLYVEGHVRDFKIEELDLIEAERDDEITLYQKYR